MAYIHSSDRPQGERRARQQRTELAHLLGQSVVFEGVQSGYKQDGQGRMRYVCLQHVFVYPFIEGEDCTKQPCVVVDHTWMNLLIDEQAEEDWERSKSELLQQHRSTWGMGVVARYQRADGSWDYGINPIRGIVIVGKMLANREHLICAARALETEGVKTAFYGVSPQQAKEIVDDAIDYMLEVHETYQRRIFGKGEGNREERRAVKRKRCRRQVKSTAAGFGNA